MLKGAEYWSLHSGGFASANFEGAWAYATGKGVLVGLVDQGVNYTHLDLSNNYATELDYDPRDDVSAHGRNAGRSQPSSMAPKSPASSRDP